MADSMEYLLMRQFLGAGGESWTHAVFLLGVFLIVIFRREQIVSAYMFRVSIILFALSLILPVVLVAIMQIDLTSTAGFVRGESRNNLFRILMAAAGPVLFGISVVMCLLSMLPYQSRYPAPPERPELPHPLD
jgi:hypothetical protein